MKKMLTLVFLSCMILISACKKKEDVEQQKYYAQSQEQQAAAVEWKITTPMNSYMGHKVEVQGNFLSFISEGKRVIVSGPYTMETQAR